MHRSTPGRLRLTRTAIGARLARLTKTPVLLVVSALLLAALGGSMLLDRLLWSAPQRTLSCTTAPDGATWATQQITPPAGMTPAGTVTVDVRVRRVCVYSTPVEHEASLMYPAVDAQGMVWFGKMMANTLVRLDPRTGVMREWAVPGGQGGIMDTLVDAQGAVWFTEASASFLGRFDPRTERFTVFHVPLVAGASAEPMRLWLDTHGALWFTAHQGMRLGRLDPSTGEIRLWVVPRLAVLDSAAYPFSIAVTPTDEVWFGTAERGGALGRLNPATGAVDLYPLPPCDTWPQDVIALAPDRAGRVWFIEHQYACMGYIETATRRVTTWQTPPAPGGGVRVLNALVLDPNTGALWMTSTGANALIRYRPETQTYTYYPLSLPKSMPYGLALDHAGALWFTANGVGGASYVGVLAP